MKSVVVTGSSSGIGAGVAAHFARQGWAVVGIDRSTREDGVSPEDLVLGDVRSRATHEAAAERASSKGDLVAWVNCAGIVEEMSVHLATQEHLDAIVGTNLLGTFWGCSVAVSAMLEVGHGSIVNVSSTQALRGRTGCPAYAASKGGIVALTTQIAAEFADRRVRCNAVLPGVINTPMNQAILDRATDPDQLERAWDVLSPIGRWGTPEDVAELAWFLAGQQSGFITGTAITVDGGQLTLSPDRALTGA